MPSLSTILFGDNSVGPNSGISTHVETTIWINATYHICTSRYNAVWFIAERDRLTLGKSDLWCKTGI